MSVIIRLQNLPWSANALDIRQYFTGLSIPEGGVHIVGGEQGDAFIAFSTDEDARQAFQRNNGKIKEIQITLSLSSRTEMQRVIEAARTQSYAAFMPSQPTVPLPAAIPIIPAAVPEVRIDLSKDKSDKREKKRSRSRDRKDRSRERDRRDRRYRDRSRSRSRDRRDSRRRRDGSRSRGRSRSRDRDRKSRDRKRSEEQNTAGFIPKKTIEPWTQNDTIPPAPQPPILIGFGGVDIPRRNLNNLDPLASGNGFNPNIVGNRGRESWPPNNMPNQNQNFNSRVNDESFKKDVRPNFGNNRQVSTYHDRGNQRNVFQRNNRLQESPGKPDSRQQAPNCCVKVEPFYGAYADVRRFFQGCFISSTGIKFINDFGTGSGIVYVQFCQQKAKFDALFRNNEMFNGVTVSVTHIDDSEFEKAVDKYLPDFNDPDDDHRNKFGGNKFKNIPKFYNKPEIRLKMFTSLTVEDLPTYVKEQDILKMFSLYPLTSIILTNKGRGGHIAYVKFSSADDAKKALEEKSQHIVENKPVTVRPCKDEDFDAINKQNELNINTKSVKKSGSDCVSVSGLPLKTSDRDIADFFSDIGVIPVKINLISNQLGFTGQAYCEFANEDESETALKKDTCVIGTQVVNVKPIPRAEMQLLLNETELGLVDIVTQLPPKLPPSSVSPQENMNSFRPMLNPGMGPNQNRHPHFMPRGNFNQGPRGRGGFMPGRGGPPRQHFNQFGPNSGGGFAEDVPPGCTVFMDNIPYKAGTNEILDFFEGYNVTNNVSRRFNLDNTPTAEAKVVFRTQEDAFIAVKEKHMQNIWDRTIYLQQV